MRGVRRTRLRSILPALAAVAAATALLPGVGGAAPDTGPTLSASAADLAATLQCPHPIEGASRDVILLVPGTTVHPRTNFGMSWMKAFEALGYPYCYVVTPDAGMSDIQVTSEHVVHAIREVHRRSGRKVDIIGHSQGGTNPRWALRWWPDTRAMVDDYIGIAPSAHGGEAVNTMCRHRCAPPPSQPTDMSHFVRALKSRGRTVPGLDLTLGSAGPD